MDVSTVDIPESNEETYRWRGDQGLLDRLAYKSAHQIPRNWHETNIDIRLLQRPRITSEPALPPLIEHSAQISTDNRTADLLTAADSVSHKLQRDQAGAEDSVSPSKKRRYRNVQYFVMR